MIYVTLVFISFMLVVIFAKITKIMESNCYLSNKVIGLELKLIDLTDKVDSILVAKALDWINASDEKMIYVNSVPGWLDESDDFGYYAKFGIGPFVLDRQALKSLIKIMKETQQIAH